jgi:hypothetical protein
VNAISPPPVEPKEATVMRLAIENVAPAWEQIYPLVRAALRGHPTHSVEDVRHRLLSNQATPWVQWSDHIEAIAVTDFVTYPQGLCLRVWLCGANRIDRLDTNKFSVALKDWARANKCRWIESVGRIGWARLIPDVKIEGVVVRHTLEDAP